MASPSNWQTSFTNGNVIPNSESSAALSNLWGGGALATSSSAYASGIFGNTGYSSLSELTSYSEAYSLEGQEALQSLGLDSENLFPPSDIFSPLSPSDTGWTFIVAPEDISWDVNAKVDRIEMYGTNAPPVVSGTKGMRDLTLGNALVEGFSRLRTVEDKIIELENLQNFSLNSSEGFVNTPVYQIWANSKKYGYANGVDGGYFIISSISIKETMRDLDGNSTRAFVDIKLVQVPSYQVDSGRDQASAAQAGAKSILPSIQNQANQAVGGATAAAKAASGASSASSKGSGGTSTKTTAKTTGETFAPGKPVPFLPKPIP